MSKILVVIPFSGRSFGGGLAVFNQELTRAIVNIDNSVKLLAINIADASEKTRNPQTGDHGSAEIIYLNDEPCALKDPRKFDKERDSLYEMINSPDELFAKKNRLREKISGRENEWQPDIIIGHSRFSGPAAILLKEEWFKEAKVEYFLHSYPVEGTVLTGYDAYDERIDAALAMEKIRKEGEWMRRADIVVPVGPFLRAGALKLLDGAKVRVHECIGGTEVSDEPVTYTRPRDTVSLLLNGRANAPIKGLEDILLAAQLIRDDRSWTSPFSAIKINVRYWESRQYGTDRTVDIDYVQKFSDSVVKLPQGKTPHNGIQVEILGMTARIMDDVRASHGVLMPSYIEHFGLVPVEALGVGVPVLMNEVSGAGMFLGNPKRFGDLGRHCVVEDFHKRISPSNPDDFLNPAKVPSTAFDGRPEAWATAIKHLLTDLDNRFHEAGEICTVLRRAYTWDDCAKAVVSAASIAYGRHAITQQGPRGIVWDADGNSVI